MTAIVVLGVHNRNDGFIPLKDKLHPEITDNATIRRYLGEIPTHGRLDVKWQGTQRTEVFYVPSKEAVDYLENPSIPTRIKLLDIDRSKQRLTIHPINTRWTIETFLKPKYPQIRRLMLTGQHFIDLPYRSDASTTDEDGLPPPDDEVMMLLEDLPSSFIKDYEYGLGFSGDFKILVSQVEKLTEATEILITDQHATGLINNNETFAISSEDFEEIRKLVNRISNNCRTAMRTVKIASVHNMLAQKLSLPEEDITYGRSPLRKKFTQVAVDGESVLSKAEQSELMNTVSKHAKSLVEEQPDKLLRLQRDVEVVTLENLITQFEAMINKNLQEKEWQSFLNQHRFLLGIIFRYPVIIVQEQASVGGHKLSGIGDKSTDFLIKNSLTNNVGIIEIKKPTSPLLYKKDYRKLVYAASKDLSGAINQVIDQKHNLMSRFAQKKDDSCIYDIESYAINCCLIIGKIPDDEKEIRSFEYIRGNSKDVEIITFDEMLEKMKIVKECLSGEGVDNGAVNEPFEPLF